jgi:hypothetical protein
MNLTTSSAPAPAARSLRSTRALRRAVTALVSTLWLGGAATLAGAAEPAKPPVAKPAAKPPTKAPAKAPAAAKPVEPPKPLEPVLSRAELRECMLRKSKLRKDTAEGARLQAELSAEKAEIDRDGEALKTELATLDRASVVAVDQYNLRARARDARIDVFQPKAAAFNASVGTLDSSRAAYARDCENKKFDEKDEIALEKELGL